MSRFENIKCKIRKNLFPYHNNLPMKNKHIMNGNDWAGN